MHLLGMQHLMKNVIPGKEMDDASQKRRLLAAGIETSVADQEVVQENIHHAVTETTEIVIETAIVNVIVADDQDLGIEIVNDEEKDLKVGRPAVANRLAVVTSIRKVSAKSVTEVRNLIVKSRKKLRKSLKITLLRRLSSWNKIFILFQQ